MNMCMNMAKQILENGLKFEFFTIICIDSLLVYKIKYCLQLHLENCTYKTVDKQMIDYLDEYLFESDEDQFFDSDKWVL